MYHCHIKLIEPLSTDKCKYKNLLLKIQHHKLKMLQLLKQNLLKIGVLMDLVDMQKNLQEERNTIKNQRQQLALNMSKLKYQGFFLLYFLF